MQEIREFLENRQIAIYFSMVIIAATVALLIPGTTVLEADVNSALAVMLFVPFLQVPLAALKRAFSHVRFLAALIGGISSVFRFW